MARPKRGDVRHEGVRCKPVDDIREQHRERALAVARRQVTEGARIVRFHEFGLHLGQHVEHASQRQAAALRDHVMLHPVGERHHADIVVVLYGGVGQLEPGLHHMLQSRHARRFRGEEPSEIQQQHDVLPALRLVLARDDLTAPRGRLPVDVPQIVPRHPLAQRFEQPAFAQAAQGRPPLLMASLRSCNGRAQPHRHERWVHRDVPWQRDRSAAAAQPERPR